MVKFILSIFRSCQTNNLSTKPEHHSPPCQRRNVISDDFPCTAASPPPLNQTPRSSSFRSHVSSAFRCSSRSQEYLQKCVVTKVCDVDIPRSKIYNSDNDQGFHIPLPTLPPFHRKKTRNNEKCAYSYEFSTGEVSPEWGSPARLSVFKKLMPCKVEGKVRESFAVVKRSKNPYEDFKKSMMEMIVENQMYEESDLKQLLQCYLSLNNRIHHGVIMEAFSEIWQVIFVDL